jgi:N-acetyl-alpha-D-muramate 1-phosphate uridylyltransferase
MHRPPSPPAHNIPAIVLAAGRGERLRPFTDTTPKPLLPVRGKPLAQWHLEALAAAGVTQVVMNTAWLEDRFAPTLGDGSRFGLGLHYSMEGRDHGGALETAGGIAKALPHLGPVFWVVSGDVFVPGFAFAADEAQRFAASPKLLAKLWLAPNAAHHGGDFGIDTATGLASDAPGVPKRTWASIGLFRAAMFKGIAPGTRLPLRPLLDRALKDGRLAAEAWDGPWTDVGTVERWQSLEIS